MKSEKSKLKRKLKANEAKIKNFVDSLESLKKSPDCFEAIKLATKAIKLIVERRRLIYELKQPKFPIINGIATVEQFSNGVKIITVTKPDGTTVQPGETIRAKINNN